MKDIGIVLTEPDEGWDSNDVLWFTGENAAEEARNYLVAEGVFEEVQES